MGRSMRLLTGSLGVVNPALAYPPKISTRHEAELRRMSNASAAFQPSGFRVLFSPTQSATARAPDAFKFPPCAHDTRAQQNRLPSVLTAAISCSLQPTYHVRLVSNCPGPHNFDIYNAHTWLWPMRSVSQPSATGCCNPCRHLPPPPSPLSANA